MRQLRAARASTCVVTAMVAIGVLSACTGGGSTEQTPSPSPSSVTASASAAADCQVGTFQVTGINATEGTSTPLGALRVTAAPGVLTLVLRADDTWTLTADPSKPVTLEAAGITAQGTADGSVEGRYTRSGDRLDFTTTNTSGTVTAEIGGTSRTFPLEQVARVVAPSGSTTVTCDATDLTLGSQAVTLTLTRVADATGTPSASSETPTPAVS